MTLADVHVKPSVVLKHRSGRKILSALRMKGQVLHRECAQLKVLQCIVFVVLK